MMKTLLESRSGEVSELHEICAGDGYLLILLNDGTALLETSENEQIPVVSLTRTDTHFLICTPEGFITEEIYDDALYFQE